MNLKYAPDMIIGYRPLYCASWETPLGAVPSETVVDEIRAGYFPQQQEEPGLRSQAA